MTSEAKRLNCPTGIEGLDEILSGGLPENRLYLLQGTPGVGKTTFAIQFLLEGIRRGEKSLYITLSETSDELHAVAESHGWNLENLNILELSAIQQQLGDDSENTFFHPSELELNRTAQILVDEVERVKPRRVVLDSLSEFRLLAELPLRYRRQMLKLKQFFAGRNSTVLLLDDLSRQDSDLHIQSIAHGVITLERMAVSYGIERRRLQIEKLRGLRFREGSHDYRIEKGGLKVFPQLLASEHTQEFKAEPVPSGLAEFDALLGGGLDRGTSNLVVGPAGTGKSTLALQHAVSSAKRGETCMLFIFDETLKTLHCRAAAVNLPLEDHVASGRMIIHQVNPAELSPGEFAMLVRKAVDHQNARLIIIDSLNGYLNAMPDERFQNLQLHELLTYLNQKGVVSIMTMAQHGIIGSMVTPVDVTYLADTVILLRYYETRGQVKKAISVIKKRSGRHEDMIREIATTSQGIVIGKPLKDFRGVLTGVPIYEGKQAQELPVE